MPKPRPSRRPAGLPARPNGGAIVDQGFVPMRAKVIEVAAFLDRVERYGVADDFRCAALRDAARLLVDGKPERARRILEKLSDPTTQPAAHSLGKAAVGVWVAPARTKASRSVRSARRKK